MIYNRITNYKYLIIELSTRGIKHNIHEFPSGAIMIDIWHHDSFFVLQIEEDFIGFSELSGNDYAFDSIPDKKIFNDKDFINLLREILN